MEHSHIVLANTARHLIPQLLRQHSKTRKLHPDMRPRVERERRGTDRILGDLGDPPHEVTDGKNEVHDRNYSKSHTEKGEIPIT